MEKHLNSVEKEWQKFFNKLTAIIHLKSGLTTNSILENIAKEFNLSALRKNIQNYKSDFDTTQKLPTKLNVGASTITISNINEYLEQRYPDKITSIVTHEVNFKYYLYFYEGTEGIIKPAVLKLKLNSTKDEWENGEIFYFKNNDGNFSLSSIFNLERVIAKNGEIKNPEFFYLKATSDYPDHRHQVNFFTINIQHKPIDKRYLCFVSSSSLAFKNNLGDIPSVNFGVLKNVEYNLIETEFNSSIHPWIRNSLTRKKIVFDNIENSFFTSEQKFITETNSNDDELTVNLQFTCSKIISGNYIGFYFRNEIRNIQNNEQGGIASVIVRIENDGKATINFSKSNEDRVVYKGYFQFLGNNYKKIKGNFVIKNNGIFRFSIYLNELDNDPNYFGGIFSGFKDDKPFATPILLIKLQDTNSDLTQLLANFKPRRISKFEFSEYLNQITEYDSKISIDTILSYLNKIFSECIENIDKCTTGNN